MFNTATRGREVLTVEKKKNLRKTVLGGAQTSQRLSQALPDAANLGLQIAFLNQKYFPLVCLTDPEVGTVEEWKEKAKAYMGELTTVVHRLEKLTA